MNLASALIPSIEILKSTDRSLHVLSEGNPQCGLCSRAAAHDGHLFPMVQWTCLKNSPVELSRFFRKVVINAMFIDPSRAEDIDSSVVRATVIFLFSCQSQVLAIGRKGSGSNVWVLRRSRTLTTRADVQL